MTFDIEANEHIMSNYAMRIDKERAVFATGMTGPVVIDYKGDRVMDYQVWYLASDSDKFTGYMRIPLTKAGRNTTVCVDWLVNNTSIT